MKYLALDTETTGLNPWGNAQPNTTDGQTYKLVPARPFAFSFCNDNGDISYFRGKVNPFTRGVTLPPAMRRDIQRMLNSDVPKVMHNAPFDIRMLTFSGFTIRGTIHDSQVLAHIVTGGRFPNVRLKPLCATILDYPADDESALKAATIAARREGKRKGYAIANDVPPDYWLAPPDLCKRYAIQDAERTMLLFLTLRKELNDAKRRCIIVRAR